MAFSEKIKLKAKKKSHFRCCICHKEFVEVHHIVPEYEGGNDSLENAATLCASCHDLFGGNPEKRKQIREMRDCWWNLVGQAEKMAIKTQNIEELIFTEDKNYKEKLRERGIVIYHVIYENEAFEKSAQILFTLIKEAQGKYPNKRRFLYLDIEGHKNNLGGYDKDMFEIQKHFITEFLSQYLSEIHIPLLSFKTKRQNNEIPKILKIFNNKEETLKFHGKYPDSIVI